MSKQNTKIIIVTSLFWMAIAGVIILVQYVDKNSYNHGYADGFSKAKVILSTPVK